MKFDYLIVGAGFAGATCARQLADRGKVVMIVDKRDHIGGNAHDCMNESQFVIHKYGAHIFHTNSFRVFAFLSRFTEWRKYEHRVLTVVGDKLLPFPINLNTLRMYFDDPHMNEEQAKEVLALCEKELHREFFAGYTRKQWGKWADKLDSSVLARVAPRWTDDDRYFSDMIQAMPVEGYTFMFHNMLNAPGIFVHTGVNWSDVRRENYDRLIFTGPVDEYFEHKLGKLPYRSLAFRHTVVRTDCSNFYQQAAVVNFPSEKHAFTRIIEHKYLTGQETRGCSAVTFEYPQDDGEPYYPVPCAEAYELYSKYKLLAAAEKDVFFCGRLATYRYYNMDQVVAQAMKLVETICPS